jgi:hypothetical protein
MSCTRSDIGGRVSAGPFATPHRDTVPILVCVGLSLCAVLDMVDEVGDTLDVSSTLVT